MGPVQSDREGLVMLEMVFKQAQEGVGWLRVGRFITDHWLENSPSHLLVEYVPVRLSLQPANGLV